MTKLTRKLLLSKVEHHDGLLIDLAEISLHQLNLTDISILPPTCPNLQILYLHNNYISDISIQKIYRLKSLKYLNLTLNAITTINGLRKCEKLEKLDLTANFISLNNLEFILNELNFNINLKELYLIGNKCNNYNFTRLYIIFKINTNN